jgi:hypothetical protein
MAKALSQLKWWLDQYQGLVKVLAALLAPCLQPAKDLFSVFRLKIHQAALQVVYSFLPGVRTLPAPVLPG